MGTTPPLTADRVLRRLEWQVIRRLDGRLQGDYRTLIRGQGTDFRDLREYEPGDFYRAFSIHESIDAGKIAAECKGGVLTVHLPKAEAARPRQISVKGE